MHRAELEKLRAVIVYDTGSGRVTGYSLAGAATSRQAYGPF